MDDSQLMTHVILPVFFAYSFLLSPVQKSEKCSIYDDSLKDFGKSLFSVYHRNKLMSYLTVGHSIEATGCIYDLLF